MVTAQNGNLTFIPSHKAPIAKRRWTKQLLWRYEAEARFIKYTKIGVPFRKFKNDGGVWVVGDEGCYGRHLVRLDRALAIKANKWQMLADWSEMPPKPKMI